MALGVSERPLLETRNIYLDASIFIGQNYNYKSAAFESLHRLANSDSANIYVTDITVREVRSHISRDVSKAINVQNKFQKDARIFRNIEEEPFEEFFREINEESVIEFLNNQLDKFLKEISATVLSTSQVSIGNVFDKYFDKKPPFGDGKKKSEFPDAFSIAALEDWCRENEEKIYVASTDEDLKRHCETSDNLIAINKLAEFISIVEFHDEVLAPSVSKLLDRKHDVIKGAISESFCEQGFWIDDQEGDVNEVRVNDIEILEILLLEVGKNYAVADVVVKTNFSADISYEDLDTAIYDSEDKVLIPLHTIEKTVDQDVEYSATIRILHNVDDLNYLEIDSVEIDTERGWGFAVSSDDEWPYK